MVTIIDIYTALRCIINKLDAIAKEIEVIGKGNYEILKEMKDQSIVQSEHLCKILRLLEKRDKNVNK